MTGPEGDGGKVLEIFKWGEDFGMLATDSASAGGHTEDVNDNDVEAA